MPDLLRLVYSLGLPPQALACVVRTISYGILLVFLDHTGESPENNISVALAVYFRYCCSIPVPATRPALLTT